MIHAFDTEIANKYGIGEAIILHRMVYYLEKNIANNKHFYDGNYWIYNSVKAWQELFPYLTIDKLRAIFKNLKEKGAIVTGNYNKLSYDRTTWYAIIDFSIFETYGINIKEAIAKNDNFTDEKSQMHVVKIPNGIGETPKWNWEKSQMSFGEIPKPIPKESRVLTKESAEERASSHSPTVEVSTVNKSSYEEALGEGYADFENQLVAWYVRLTGRPVGDVRQIPDFKTPEKRQVIERAFANRKTDWKNAIKEAGERAANSNPKFRWPDFLQALYVGLQEIANAEPSFDIPDNYQGCVEYYIQDCDWNTQKFIAACQYLLYKADKTKRFSNAQLEELASAFDNRKAHAGYALMLAYDRALYKHTYINLNFYDNLIAYLSDNGDIIPRTRKFEGIIRYKYNIVFDNYISDTPKEVRARLQRRRLASNELRYTDLKDNYVEEAPKPPVETERNDANESEEEYSKCLDYANHIKQNFMKSLDKLSETFRI